MRIQRSEGLGSRLIIVYQGLIDSFGEEGMQLQRFAGWLSQICDENSRMRGNFNSKAPPKVAHARIFVANL